MFYVLIIAGVAVIAAIIFLLFRIMKLAGAIKGRKEETNPEDQLNKSSRTNAVLLLLFMVAGLFVIIWFSIAKFSEYNLPVASEHGVKTDSMFWVTTALTGAVFIITNVLLFFFAFKYRYKKENKAMFFPDNSKLEILWTLAPALVLTTLVISGLKTWNGVMSKAPEHAELVEIMGYQFAWKSRYPGNDKALGPRNYQLTTAVNEFGMDLGDQASFDDFIPREIHLPVDRPVLFRIIARDVLHSVFAPHFRLKMDAVPGMPTQFWFVPTKTTVQMREELGNPDFNYEIACAEVCGRGHFSMRMIVVVEEEEAYQAWHAAQEPWLKKNPDYLEKTPTHLREIAIKTAGLDEAEPIPTVYSGASMH